MQEPLLSKKEKKEDPVVVIIKNDNLDKGRAQDPLDEERVPLNTPGNRHTADISQPWRFEGEGRTEFFYSLSYLFRLQIYW
jgi:hypothetical protein